MELLGESPPEHGLLGRLLVISLHVTGVALYGIVLLASPSNLAAAASAGLLIPLLCSYFAESVRRFECWAWFALMFTLCPFPLAMVVALARGSVAEAAVAAWFLAPVMGVIRYLWARRRQFWTDPPAYRARRPAPRRVTPAWRAARLARIAAGAGASPVLRPVSDTFPRPAP